MAVSFSGSLDISGSLNTTGTITMSGSIASASFATTASNAVTSSYVVSSQTDATQNTRLNTIEAVTGSYTLTSSFGTYTSSNDATNTTQNSRIAANEAKTGSYATTGSNYFIGTQTITGSVYITSDLIVQGSSSLQNITASAVSIGTNTVILNTSTPILRFGGISVQDSGSSQGRSGSLFWDSLNDHWINVNPSGSDEGYNSAMVINGPKNTGSLGSELGLTEFYIPVSQGEDHITDSIIFQSGSRNIGIGTTNPKTRLQVTPVSNAEVPTLGTANGVVIFTSANSNYGLQFNSTSDGSFQIQSQRFDNVSTAYSIGLNPVGGNVGIGTASPSYTLDVNASNNVRFFGNSYTSLTIATTSGTNFSLTNRYTDNRFSIDATGYGEVMNFMSDGKVGIGTSLPNSFVEIVKSSNAGSGASFPRLAVANSLATQGNGTSTYNFADLRLAAGNAAVEVYLTATYAAGTWEPQGILNVGTNHPLSFKTNNTERMRILAGGNVGIGTTNPGEKFEVSGSIKATSRTTSGTSVGGLSIAYDGGIGYIESWNSSPILTRAYNYIAWDTSGTERMRILNGGNVGIGTTNPGYKLDVSGSSTTALRLIDSGDVGFQMMSGGSNNAFSIRTNGSTVILSTSNSYPLSIGVNSSTGGVLGSTTGLSIASGGAATFAASVGTTALNMNNMASLGSISGGAIYLPYTAVIMFRTADGASARGKIQADNSSGLLLNSDNGGYVGIGTSAPAHYMHIHNGNLGLYSNSYGNTGLMRMYGTDGVEKYQQGLTSGGDFYQYTFSGMNHIVYTNGTERLRITNGGTVQPGANGTQDLGTSSLRWGTVFTSDLSLSNGIGDYTIVEGENDLFLYNNKQNKVYKFMLAEVDPADATPKKS
jgi:hypothetical protein